MQTHTFNKEFSGWYIDLPEYIAQGGNKGDLAMVEGADTMLDIISAGGNSVTLQLDDVDFEGSDQLQQIEVCDPAKGGAIYLMPEWEGSVYNHRLWLCDVTEFVFGHLPKTIYLKRAVTAK